MVNLNLDCLNRPVCVDPGPQRPYRCWAGIRLQTFFLAMRTEHHALHSRSSIRSSVSMAATGSRKLELDARKLAPPGRPLVN